MAQHAEQEIGGGGEIVRRAMDSEAVMVFEPCLDRDVFADARKGAARLAISASIASITRSEPSVPRMRVEAG